METLPGGLQRLKPNLVSVLATELNLRDRAWGDVQQFHCFARQRVPLRPHALRTGVRPGRGSGELYSNASQRARSARERPSDGRVLG